MAWHGYEKYTYFAVTAPGPASAVAIVTINRPAKLNAFFDDMWHELHAIFTALSVDSSIRAVVLTGAGDKAFTTGLDVEAAGGSLLSPSPSADTARQAVKLRRHIDELQDCVSAIEKCEKPVICVLHGYSLGLAIDIACCTDIRVCAADARMAVKEVDIGLAADIGTLARLPKIVGSTGWVKDVALTARVFSAREAKDVGFVSHVLDTKEQALHKAVELAELIASKSPVAVQGTKELLNHAREHTVADSLRYTSVWNSAALQTNDVQQALMSGLKKRKPTFEKL